MPFLLQAARPRLVVALVLNARKTPLRGTRYLHRGCTALVSLVLAISAPLPASAQEPPEAAEVMDVVRSLFDVMRAGDSIGVRTVFHPDARLQTVGVRDGEPVLRTESVEEFARAVGSPRAEVWDERIRSSEVRNDGRLATAWVAYDFYAGATFSHCGVNAFQLFRGPDGWRVFQLTDTRRREGCDASSDRLGG